MVLRANPEKLEERERTRLSLLRATLLLAAKHGFAGLGLREVSRGAEIAPTSFYRHFTDMEELGVALVDELVAPLLQDWLERTKQSLLDSSTPAHMLLAEAHATLGQDRDLVRFVLAERVGAMVSCRRALRRELAKWAAGLTSVSLPLFVSEAALALLLENLSETLESELAGDTIKLAEDVAQTERQLAHLLEPIRKGT